VAEKETVLICFAAASTSNLNISINLKPRKKIFQWINQASVDEIISIHKPNDYATLKTLI
jgi:hypothetical protein